MLILTRLPSEKIILGENAEVEITIVEVRGKQVKVGVTAHPSIPVHREEIYNRVKSEKPTAVKSEKA